jgi:hypothetical protein
MEDRKHRHNIGKRIRDKKWKREMTVEEYMKPKTITE